MSALYNALGVSMVHRYYDEGCNYWGIEKWGPGNGRKLKRYKSPDDLAELEELFGYTEETDG